MKTRVAVLTFAFAVTSCIPDMDGAPCAGDADCPSGQTCQVRKDGASTGFGECRVKNDGQPFVAGGGDGATGGGAAVGGGDATTGGGSATGGGDGTTGGGATTGGGDGTTGGGVGVTGGGATDDGGVDAGVSALSAMPSPLAFGDVVQTGSGVLTVTITNTGLDVTGTLSVMLSGPDAARFAISNDGCTAGLASLGSCDVEVTFTPNGVGARSAALVVSATPGGSLSVPLTGTGRTDAQLTLSPLTADAGEVLLGASATQRFTVINTGGMPSGTPILTSNQPEVSIVNVSCNGPVAASNGSCQFDAVLNPSSTGVKVASVFAAAAPGSTAIAQWSGRVLLPPALTIAPSPVEVGGVLLGGSQTFPVTVRNTGGATATGLSVVVDGGAGSAFSLASTDCGSLAPDAGCNAVVRFEPVAAGAQSAELAVVATGASARSTISGTGQRPAALALSDVPLNFGQVASNASVTLPLRIENTGDLDTTGPVGLSPSTDPAGHFTWTGCGAALQAHTSCTLNVTYAPNNSNSGHSFAGNVVSGAATAAFSFVGAGVQPANLTFEPSQWSPSAVQGQSVTQTFLLRNNGGAVATLTASGISGAGFQIISNGCGATTVLTNNQTCSIDVRYSASGTTTQPGQLTASTASTSALATLTGTPLRPAALSFDLNPVQFDDTVVGATSRSASVTVTNTGDVSSGTIGSSIILSADFVIISSDDTCTGATVAAGQSCTMRLAFTPQGGLGLRSAVLELTQSSTSSTTTLRGTALAPPSLSFDASPSPAFGDVEQSSKVSRTFTLRNTGGSVSGSIQWTLSLGTNAPFQLDPGQAGDCVVNAQLAPSESCTLSVNFNPTAMNLGDFTATLQVTSASPEGGGSPTRALTGRAVTPPKLDVVPTVLDFGLTAVNQTAATQNFTVTNIGGAIANSVDVVGTSAPFSCSDNCPATLAPDAGCQVACSYTPTVGSSAPNVQTVSLVRGSLVDDAVTVRGQSGWPLTVTRNSPPTGSAVVVGSQACTATTCTYVFAHGTAQQAISILSNGSGSYFQGWNSPAECQAYGLGDRCNVTIDAAKTLGADYASIGNGNLGFVSSVTTRPTGGVAGFDALCNLLASDAGINSALGNAYVAYVSTSTMSASSRLAAGAIRRTNGTLFVSSKTDLLANKIRYPMHLDERGKRVVGDPSVWTGTNADGTSATQNCATWTRFVNDGGTADAVHAGSAEGGPALWTDIVGTHTCGSTSTHVLCFQNAGTNSVGGSTMTGQKRVFLSPPVSRPTSRANADALCNANKLGISGTFKALLAGSGVAAATGVVDAGTTYFRLDGTAVGTGAEIFASAVGSRTLRSGIWQYPDGGYVTPPATGGDPYPTWTGGSGPGATGNGSTTCDNWTLSTNRPDGGGPVTVLRGNSGVAAENFFNSYGAGGACAGQWGLYCVEQ